VKGDHGRPKTWKKGKRADHTKKRETGRSRGPLSNGCKGSSTSMTIGSMKTVGKGRGCLGPKKKKNKKKRVTKTREQRLRKKEKKKTDKERGSSCNNSA